MKTTKDILTNSQATAELKKAVEGLEQGSSSPLIKHDSYLPKVKIMRTMLKLLDHYAGLKIEKVVIDGASGCSYFRGKLKFYAPEEHSVRFDWDCAWRAQQAGYVTSYGSPDQVRAAKEFGYNCFKLFTEE